MASPRASKLRTIAPRWDSMYVMSSQKLRQALEVQRVVTLNPPHVSGTSSHTKTMDVAARGIVFPRVRRSLRIPNLPIRSHWESNTGPLVPNGLGSGGKGGRCSGSCSKGCHSPMYVSIVAEQIKSRCPFAATRDLPTTPETQKGK